LSPYYRQGWNDRVAKRGEDYGKVYRTVGGDLAANRPQYKGWAAADREAYVNGWDAACAAIAALAIPEGAKVTA
jgi:hypothetical protein